MRKMGIAALAAASIVAMTAQGASAAGVPGPCERQQQLFDKYNIELGMHSDEAAYVYNTACDVTG